MCEYCKDLPKEIDKNNMIEVLSSNGFVLFGSYVDGYETLEAKYCPMCGRNLKKKYDFKFDYEEFKKEFNYNQIVLDGHGIPITIY